MTQWDLAQCFEQSRDTWLSDHFYNQCLETGVQIKGDGRRKEGEAHCHVGLALENRGEEGGREGEEGREGKREKIVLQICIVVNSWPFVKS